MGCLLVFGLSGSHAVSTAVAVPTKDGRLYQVQEGGQWVNKCYCTVKNANCEDCEDIE